MLKAIVCCLTLSLLAVSQAVAQDSISDNSAASAAAQEAAALPPKPEPQLEAVSSSRPNTLTDLKSRWELKAIAPKKKGVGKSFWIMSSLLVGSTIADAEMTLSCLNRNTCREGNPMFGSHPSRARVYFTISAVNGAFLWWVHRKKNEAPDSHIEYITLPGTVLHTALAFRGAGM